MKRENWEKMSITEKFAECYFCGDGLGVGDGTRLDNYGGGYFGHVCRTCEAKARVIRDTRKRAPFRWWPYLIIRNMMIKFFLWRTHRALKNPRSKLRRTIEAECRGLAGAAVDFPDPDQLQGKTTK